MTKSSTVNMTVGRELKLLVTFSVPIILGIILQNAYNLIDAVIVGDLIGTNSLSAVGSTGAVTSLVISTVQGLTGGFAVVIGKKYGEENNGGVKRVYHNSLLLTLALCPIITILGMVFSKDIVALMNTAPELADEAGRYLFIIFAGSSTTLLYNFFADILRSLGNSKMPLVFLFSSCVLHIALNYLFIAGFGMGVEGAAFSSVLSQAICVALCIIYIKKRIPILDRSGDNRRFCLKTVRELLSIGIPMALTNFVVHFGVLILQFVTNGIGAAYVATYTVASRIGYMLTAPIFGVTNALSAFISQNWGAGKHERIRRAVFLSNLLLIITNAVILSLIFFFGKAIIGSLSGWDSFIMDNGRIYLLIRMTSGFALCLAATLKGAFPSIGRPMLPMVSGIIEVIVRFIAPFTLTKHLGFAGVALTDTVIWVILALFFLVAYLRLPRDLGYSLIQNETEIKTYEK